MKEHSCNHDPKGRKVPCPKKVPIFQALSDEEIMKIAQMTRHIRYSKGQMLLNEGENSDKLFIVNYGQVKVSKFTLDG